MLVGWKTTLISLLVMVLPGLVPAVEAYVTSHPGWSGALVGGVFFFLRQITKTPSALLPKPE